jgi:mono/diheme cytochrome c family protein
MNNRVSRALWACGSVYVALTATISHCEAAESTHPVRTGPQVYKQVCAQCHETGVGPVIMGRGLNLPVVKFFVRNGNGAMPAWRVTEISDPELAQVANWLEKSPAPAADPKRQPARSQ